jgi:hypothetical protein
MASGMSDWICQDGGPGRTFAAFNFGLLTDEPVSDSDFSFVGVDGCNECASMAWSADVDWYFVVVPAGILMVQVGSDSGLLCSKKSWRLIEEFLKAPAKRKKRE